MGKWDIPHLPLLILKSSPNDKISAAKLISMPVNEQSLTTTNFSSAIL